MALDENDVSAAVCRWLETRGYSTNRIVAGQTGFDISAVHRTNGERWVIEAKGATSSRHSSAGFGKEYGSNTTFQAVASALLTAISWTEREELSGMRIGIAIPRTRWFDVHSKKIETVCSKLGIALFRVDGPDEVALIDR